MNTLHKKFLNPSDCEMNPSEIVNGWWYTPHLARQLNKELLWDAIQDRLQRKLVTETFSNDGNLVIYSYSRDAQFDKRWDPIVMACRGLVMDAKTHDVVATPFMKFFNHGEYTGLIPHGDPEVFEKIDGSLGIVFYYNDQWHVATKGSFHSEQAEWATQWLRSKHHFIRLDTRITYLTEILYPENRIVIDYKGREGLVLLGGIDCYGYELIHEDLLKISNMDTDWTVAPKYRFNSIADTIESANSYNHNFEGYVLRWPNGYRLKIKGQEYLKIHRLISDFTPKKIWELVRDSEDLLDYKKSLPEEFHDDFDETVSSIRRKEARLILDIESLVKKYAHLNDRELGLKISEIRSSTNTINESALKFLFAARKKKFLDKCSVPGQERDMLYREIEY